MSQKIRFDFVSDVVCPWCIIGYKQVEKALNLYKDIEGEALETEFHWHPFELNPHMPPEGQDGTEHVAEKYGRTKEQSKKSLENMRQIGEGLGFEFNFSDGMHIYNSFKAHKLLHWAGKFYGSIEQTTMKMAFFKAYFQDRVDISDDDVLLAAVKSALPNADHISAAEALKDEAVEQQVRAEQKFWRDRDIQGVPAIIIDEKFMVPGAQDAQTFVNVIRKVISQREAA